MIIAVLYGLHQITLYCMYVALMAFHAKISDPSIGGTYMTLLNTVTNLGGNWPATLALWFIDPLTFKSCSVDGFSCKDSISQDKCKSLAGECLTVIDGYYIQVLLCITIGLIWLKWGKSKIKMLQNKHSSAWKCNR